MTGIAHRVGPIYTFDAESPVTREQFLKASRNQAAPVPVVIRSFGDDGVLATGSLSRAKLRGASIVGSIKWPREIEEIVGKSTPSAHCEFNDDGSLSRVVVELEEEESCGCADCEAGGTCQDKPEPKVKAVAKNSSVETIYDRQLERFDGDPERLAKALIRNTSKLASSQIPADHVAVPKSDAELLAAYRELGSPDDLRSLSTDIVDYRAISPDPKKLRKEFDESTTKAKTLEDQIAARDREKIFGDIAQSRGYNPAVFNSVIATNPALLPEGAEFVPAKRVVGRNAIDSFDVKYVGDDGKPATEPIEDFEEKRWADLMPALRPTGPIGIARTGSATAVPETGLRDPVGAHRFAVSSTNRKAIDLARASVLRDMR